VTRWALLTVLAVMALGAAGVLVARVFGRSDSRASVLVSVVAHWLAAYVLWTLAGGLGQRYGVLTAYDSYLFVVLALAVGFWHYRVRLARGREPGLAVFVGGQLAWLVIVLIRNDLLKY
jgi:lipopolysaccharide export LptBFGC system permease protein LptF